jgi:hypothetical protein
MLSEYSDYYSEASKLLSDFGDSLSGIHFDERRQALDIFSLMSLSLCSSHARAVSILLKDDFAVESIVIVRSFQEILFDFHWIFQSDDENERNERVFKLEAHPYHKFAKEVRLIEKDVQSSTPHWSKEKYEQMKAALEDIAAKSPFLVSSSSAELLDFKQAPDLASRMGQDNRLHYYHVYRFSSLFTHPTPMIKELFVKPVGTTRTGHEIISEPLQQFLAYGLLFLELIMGFAVTIFSKHKPEHQSFREKCYDSMFALTEKGNKDFFPTQKHGETPGQTA